MSFTPKRTLEFIETFRSYRLLWDPNHQDYRYKKKKNRAWDELAADMKMSRHDVTLKVHNLRSQFRRELKKEREAAREGTVKTNQWFAFDALKFLIVDEATYKYPEYKRDTGNNTMLTEELDLKSEVYICEDSETEYPPSEELEENNLSPLPESNTSTSLKRKWRSDSENEDDEFSTYGKYVASELRTLKDEHSMIMAKHHISTILTKARLGKYCQKETDFGSDYDSP